ncbi:hypothetical protein [Ekhidna sp.]|uniref:hypothetical protein n=1 Tax=Ekhidna sp. TaxID=2608089 RepID=UPI003296FD4E
MLKNVKMDMEQENRITEAMNSLDGIQGAKAPADGFAKIQQKLANHRMQKEQHPVGSWMKVAAVVALVICSNVWAVSNYWTSESVATEDSSSYPQLMTDFNLYDYE